ncbi:MAG: isoleucine--tRNA ligase [Bacteroidales bacterium]|nr:isoleucine--tRNA ligase [Bacteroidales bacterium]MCF8386939.1 isoleucine--tRNA ligase [Bacteroidales bacterium]MCF8397446.1 isoleucine--tRNA ligase [Bacteroidales bacterium]
MEQKYQEYKKLNLPEVGKKIEEYWKDKGVFAQSLSTREGKKPYIFYEGPPSANGMPGIHHVLSRAIKDIFCRYKTLKGYYVKRKAGWDTHGLPIEIATEKTLGITKEDIGTKISVEDYNKACRKEVMKYKDQWDELTRKMGYWVDLDDPYITFDNKYIETVWYLLKQLYEKGLLYKGYTIQPYSPAAGTGLSSHELNLPGCYKDVKDTTVTAQFKIISNEESKFLHELADTDVYFLAWTTTPWTLPSNTALAFGKKIDYVLVRTFNSYTDEPITVILAKDRFNAYFSEDAKDLKLEDYKSGDKKLPYKILGEFKGSELEGIRYEQLIPWIMPMGDAFRAITGDFVTTEDGTGIVHIAPTFGADDDMVAKQHGISPLFLIDKEGKKRPMVDLRGRFFRIEDLDQEFVSNYVKTSYEDYAGRFVKNEYDKTLTEADPQLDVDLAVMLKLDNKAFKIEKYVHNYPHCWRTDKPVLYYPLDSWFIKTTAFKDKMLELNNTINWKPKSTGTGRFGNWLENLVDWNLSRSRFWGVPLPVWSTEDGKERKCLGSARELKEEIEKSIAAGYMDENPLNNFDPDNMTDENYKTFDFHRPYVDKIVLVSKTGQKMHREMDLIDVWFDSGSMPYAQFHYPFENKEVFDKSFPANFIAEGVDQTRGWFFTMHAIAVMLFDSVSYKTCVSNGLILDKNGNKMSKRLGNAVDPFETIQKYGPDPLRWYLMTNAQPWDNLKFDNKGIEEVQRKFFGTLYNTYAFFALYANIDGFAYKEKEIPYDQRPEIDRWILSELNSLMKFVDESYEDYEPTKAGRAIAEFVDDHLSNWYVRLSRRRFWKGDYTEDKISAYQTLYRCLEVLAQIASPIAPFFMDQLFIDLNRVTKREAVDSVHLAEFPKADLSKIDKDLEERMELAQQFSSMVLSLRKKTNIRVRQPLNKIMIPVPNKRFRKQLEEVEDLIKSEVNIKEVEYLAEDNKVLVKKIKPNFKSLGPRYGKLMKKLSQAITSFSQDQINKLETDNYHKLDIDDQEIELSLEDVEITTDDIPGWVVATEDHLTVALDITITEKLKEEGIAREVINKIQNLRKENKFEVTDKILLQIGKNTETDNAINNNISYICSETLAKSLELKNQIDNNNKVNVELFDNLKIDIAIEKAD